MLIYIFSIQCFFLGANEITFIPSEIALMTNLEILSVGE
jgi:hypothetical protein